MAQKELNMRWDTVLQRILDEVRKITDLPTLNRILEGLRALRKQLEVSK